MVVNMSVIMSAIVICLACTVRLQLGIDLTVYWSFSARYNAQSCGLGMEHVGRTVKRASLLLVLERRAVPGGQIDSWQCRGWR